MMTFIMTSFLNQCFHVLLRIGLLFPLTSFSSLFVSPPSHTHCTPKHIMNKTYYDNSDFEALVPVLSLKDLLDFFFFSICLIHGDDNQAINNFLSPQQYLCVVPHTTHPSACGSSEMQIQLCLHFFHYWLIVSFSKTCQFGSYSAIFFLSS